MLAFLSTMDMQTHNPGPGVYDCGMCARVQVYASVYASVGLYVPKNMSEIEKR